MNWILSVKDDRLGVSSAALPITGVKPVVEDVVVLLRPGSENLVFFGARFLVGVVMISIVLLVFMGDMAVLPRLPRPLVIDGMEFSACSILRRVLVLRNSS